MPRTTKPAAVIAPSPDELFDPTAYTSSRVYPDGAAIYTPRTPADRLYLIKSGRVRLLAAREGDVLTEILGPGMIAGSIERLTGARQSEHAVAVGEVTVFELEAANLERYVHDHPRGAMLLLEAANARANRLAQRAQGFAFRDIPARLASALLDLAADHGTECAHGGGGFDLDGITQQDLADLIGSSRPFASTNFARWRRQGLVDLYGRTICVRDLRKLRALALEEHRRT